MVVRPLALRCAAEVAGTTSLVGIGTGAIAAGATAGASPQWLIAIAWFAAVAVPVVALAAVSGAHLNPAVTLALAAANRFPWSETVPYAAAQVGGAFGGSLAVLAVFGRAGHLGATVPHAVGPGATFGLEFGFTLALVASVLHLTNPRRAARDGELLLPAAVVGVSTYLIGPWTGSSLNPARSLAPAVLSGTFTDLWVYAVAAVAAALVGAGSVAVGRRLERRARGPPTSP